MRPCRMRSRRCFLLGKAREQQEFACGQQGLHAHRHGLTRYLVAGHRRGQTGIGLYGLLGKIDHAARQGGEGLDGDLRFGHRFVECDVTIETDPQKLKVQSPHLLDHAIVCFRILRIGKMDVGRVHSQFRFEQAEEVAIHVCRVGKGMVGRNPSDRRCPHTRRG